MNPYWELFEDFATAELASGGPDPQVLVAARAAQARDWRHAQLAAGWFVAPYTLGAAAALWSSELWDADEETLRQWLVVHADGLPTRRERRSIWGAEQRKLARCLVSWREWVDEVQPHELAAGRLESYADLYFSINDRVDYFGRYATMKVIEVLYQAGLVRAGQSDIRAKGAKYPRKMLALLWPEHAVILNGAGDSSVTVQLAEELGRTVQDYLGRATGRAQVPTMFQVETLLCNARQALDGKYPGRSHDRELAHWVRAERYWTRDHLTRALPFFELRRQLFPVQHLGEWNDPPWWGSREALEVAAKARVTEVLACTSG